VRGYGAFRELPTFDDIAFKFDPAALKSVSKLKESCNTRTLLGGKFGGKPLDLAIPVLIAPMSFGALSKNLKMALAKGSALAGTASNTGEGGMCPEERANADKLIYQCLSGRFGFNPHDMKKADAIELYISQGAKPGLGGQLMGKKITEEIARIRGIPKGIDLRSPSRHPDVMGADDLVIKIDEFREATDWRVPISLKLGAGRLKDDIKIALKDNVRLRGDRRHAGRHRSLLRGRNRETSASRRARRDRPGHRRPQADRRRRPASDSPHGWQCTTVSTEPGARPRSHGHSRRNRSLDRRRLHRLAPAATWATASEASPRRTRVDRQAQGRRSSPSASPTSSTEIALEKRPSPWPAGKERRPPALPRGPGRPHPASRPITGLPLVEKAARLGQGDRP
jgi:hypothetical protein